MSDFKVTVFMIRESYSFFHARYNKHIKYFQL